MEPCVSCIYISPIVWNVGSFENEALENEDGSTKHPNLENEAPKLLENEAPIENEALENEDP